MSKNLLEAVLIVAKYFQQAPFGCFNCRNMTHDRMENLYSNWNHLVIDICRDWGYLEVFGLTEEEFKFLEFYYTLLAKTYRK